MTEIWNVQDFLSQYSVHNTRRAYLTSLRAYFKLHYAPADTKKPLDVEAILFVIILKVVKVS